MKSTITFVSLFILLGVIFSPIIPTQVFARIAAPTLQTQGLQPIPTTVQPNISGNVNNTVSNQNAGTSNTPSNSNTHAASNEQGSTESQGLLNDSSLQTTKKIIFVVIVIILVCILYVWKRKGSNE